MCNQFAVLVLTLARHCIIFVYSLKTVCWFSVYFLAIKMHQSNLTKICKSSLRSSMHPFQAIQNLVLDLQTDVVCGIWWRS